MPKVSPIIEVVGMSVTENAGPSVVLKQFCAGQLVNVRRKENQFLLYTYSESKTAQLTYMPTDYIMKSAIRYIACKSYQWEHMEAWEACGCI